MDHSYTTAGVCVFCGCSPATAAEKNQPKCILADRHLTPAEADELERRLGSILRADREWLRRAIEEEAA